MPSPTGCEHNLVHPTHHLVGPLQTGPRRQLANDCKVSDVLLRDEARSHPGHLKTSESDKCEVDQKYDPSYADKSACQIAVTCRQPIKRGIEARENRVKDTSEPLRLIVFVTKCMGLQHDGTERRAESE
jgi:hypothetical protein